LQGEWTVAPTDCSQKMDWVTYTSEEAFGKQIGSGSHFDGTLPDSTFVGSCEGKSGHASTFSEEYKVYLGKLWEVQADAYEAGTGWVMWAWVSLVPLVDATSMQLRRRGWSVPRLSPRICSC
jgi:glucan 1,3-beta-glucosidase